MRSIQLGRVLLNAWKLMYNVIEFSYIVQNWVWDIYQSSCDFIFLFYDQIYPRYWTICSQCPLSVNIIFHIGMNIHLVLYKAVKLSLDQIIKCGFIIIYLNNYNWKITTYIEKWQVTVTFLYTLYILWTEASHAKDIIIHRVYSINLSCIAVLHSIDHRT